MTKKMLINATHPEENRVAIVEDGILTELDIEIEGKEQTKGNIYKAVVVRVEPGLQAAFIDYGAERLGFLQMGELHPSFFRAWESRSEGKRARIGDILHKGQELLVQVIKEERGTKGAALTTYISLAGRYMVLMPDSDTKGVSRKIEEDSQRKKIKEAMGSLDLPSQMGYIVRTAGIGQKKEELKRDFDYLVKVYENIQSLGAQVKAPALIYKESNLVIRSIRDYFSADMDEVLVDDPRVFQEATEFFNQVMPAYVRLVKLHQERRPIFSRYQIEEQIETIYKNKVPLPSGGSIVIDATEALVAIDVNSGKMASEQGVEATAYKTNLEAAAEAGRQLRLRDLGGLIVLDFIDMRDRKHIRDVEKALRDALKNDKARVTLGRISQFGLLEMSRQRIKATLAEGAYLPCPHCNGSGRIKSAEAQSIAFLRKIHAGVAKGQIGRVEGEVPLEVATYLLNTKKEELLEMERRHNVSIFIKGRPDFTAGQTEVDFLKREKEESASAETVEAVTALSVAVPSPDEGKKTAASPAEGEPAAEEGAKRKRKRRRRKKPAGEEAAAAAVQETEEAAVAEPPVAAAAEPAQTEVGPTEEAAVPTTEAQPEQPTEDEAHKKKRRRRRRKKPAETTAPETPATAAAQEETLPPAEPAPATEAEGPLPSEEPKTPTPPAEESAPAAKPTAKKPQRRRKKMPEEATSPATTETAPAPLPLETPAPTVAAEPAPAPEAEATQPGAKVEKKEAAPIAATSETGAPENKETSAQAEKPKPVRKRAPRKIPAALQETAVTETAAPSKTEKTASPEPVAPMAPAGKPEEAAAEAPAAPKKPARKRTPRKTKTEGEEKKPAPTKKTAAAKPSDEEGEPEKAAPKPRKRAPRKTAAATAEEKQKEPTAEEAPKKRPTRRKKPAASSEKEQEAAKEE